MWRHDDDGVDDSPLLGNQREERIIITQLNYTAIPPRLRHPLQGFSLKLIRRPVASGGPAGGKKQKTEKSSGRCPHLSWRKKEEGVGAMVQDDTGEREGVQTLTRVLRPHERRT